MRGKRVMRNTGFSLGELLVTMAIISILTAIALPGYRNYVIRANRTDAKTALLSMAGALERCFTRFNAYDNAGCTVDTSDVVSNKGHYIVNATAQSPTTFTLTAVPQGGQADDTGCANSTLDNVNIRGVSGTKPVAGCWGR